MAAPRRGRTRIAPTPSGFLHLGNVVHFLAVETWAHQLELDVCLRIDMFDAPRVQPRYVDDIFRVLEALEIQWSIGPRDPSECERAVDRAWAWQELVAAHNLGLCTYACDCSRQDVRRGHTCRCLIERLEFAPKETALRLDAAASGLEPAMDGVVLWRRDDLPSFHLMSLLSDRDLGITHVLRGRDLEQSTAVQRAIAPFFDASDFAGGVFIHHDVILDDSGRKLSKSAGAQARPLVLPGTAELRRAAVQLLSGNG